MSKPATKNCAAIIEYNGRSVRIERVGKGPLVNLWVQEIGNGGRGIFLDVEQTEDLIEGLNDLLDEIEADPHASAGRVRELLHAEGVDRL